MGFIPSRCWERVKLLLRCRARYASIRFLRHPKSMESIDRPRIESRPDLFHSNSREGSKEDLSPLSDASPSLEGVRLVLIDDELGVLKALSMVLQAFKCCVTPFSSSSEAVAHLIQRHQGCSAGALPHLDVIVSDLRMPGLSGLDVLTQIRAAGLRTPFILTSGHATAEDVDEAHSLGANGFLPKPFSPPQLAAEVWRVRGKRKDALRQGE
jgi:CheY-like chemotaxis protein